VHERTRYTHLLPHDAPILTAYLTEHGHRYTFIDFDLRVGAGRDPGPDFDNNIRMMALDLSRRRCDAVGWDGTTGTIIEVTNAAGTTALGQLITYANLYKQDHPNQTPPHLIIVARTMQTDMATAYTALGIEIQLYPNAPDQ
jgi:hypothetical protein